MHKKFTPHLFKALLLMGLSLMLSCTIKNSSSANVSSSDNFTGICKVTGTIPTIPDVTTQSIVTSLSEPVHVTNAGDGSGRLFIVEKRGTVQVLLNDSIQTGAYLDIKKFW